MSTTHRPDYEAFRQECTGRILMGLSKFQEAYKWPYINLQDLSRKSLVIFITSRGHNPPSAFARADLNATHLGTVAHFIPEPAFLPFQTLLLDGDKVETYGRLVAWEEDDAATDLMFTERQFSHVDGLKAFELQERIYPFLIRCCELILHDFTKSGALLDPSIPTGIASDPIITPEPPTAAIAEILPSLATISAEAPYRLPANIDFERLREIFAARLSAAEDYLFDLREDPGFFADIISDWSEHRNDALLDTNGNPHPTFLLHQQAALLCTLMEKYKDEISYNKQIPKDLKISAEAPINYLQNIQSSPPLRHHFTRAPQAPEESKNISSYIADRFSDLAILFRALSEVDNYQPWAATFDKYNKNHQGEVLRITMTDFVFNKDYLPYIDSVLRGILPYCMPGDGKFKYPVNKKRTKQSTEQMILAEKNLDFFWEKFDANWKKLTRKNIDGCFGGHPPRKRGEIQITSSWVKSLPIKATTKIQQASSTQEWAHYEEKTKFKTKSKKAKYKTRGSTQPLTQPEVQPEAQPENPKPQSNV
ncbi:hypothetical protein EAF00_011850 [Botryotinia globosa]|nr:hypothetical protein EAF00_011850 [Botryotinia globosa]